jgi:hypothetical protein
MKLSTLAILLGLVFAAPNVYGVLKPAQFATAARKFPRYTPIGYVLMLLATFWFVSYVQRENIADFEGMKPYLSGLFLIVGIGSCIFVKDFLPVRGLAVLMLLVAKLMVDTARWEETTWRLVISIWAYVFVVVGVWFTVSPWRMRDLIQWGTSTESRTRMLSAIRLAFGLLVALLGLLVF